MRVNIGGDATLKPAAPFGARPVSGRPPWPRMHLDRMSATKTVRPARGSVPKFPAPVLDRSTAFPLAAFAFALIIDPLLLFVFPTGQAAMHAGASRIENRIFWPAMVVLALLLAARAGTRLGRLVWPPHVLSLGAFLLLAGASTLWAYIPEISFVRFTQQAMVVTSIILPALLAARTPDVMRGLYLCCACASLLNVYFVMEGHKTIITNGSQLVDIGYEGYFHGKNYLGECAAITFLLSLHEIVVRRGWRRTLAVSLVFISVSLIHLSECKTALGLVAISPPLSRAVLSIRRMSRASVATIVFLIPVCYAICSFVSGADLTGRLAYALTGDSTLTGRTLIWGFVKFETAQRPMLGWGYKCFWLVPNSPSASAPGWVKLMPNGHNGYYDTTLELGYVGLAFLLVFLVSTFHAVGRVADRDPARARLLLSLVLFISMWNFFETLWMFGYDFLWVLFLIVAAEIGRYWQPSANPLRRGARRSGASEAGA